MPGHVWRYRLTPRSTLSIDGGVIQTTFFGDGADVLSPHGAINYSRSLSPNATLQLGYGYREFRYDSGDPARRADARHSLRRRLLAPAAIPASNPRRLLRRLRRRADVDQRRDSTSPAKPS